MEDVELFKKRIASYIDKAYAGGVSLLNFLDEAQIGILDQLAKKSNLEINYYGGFKYSDRLRAIISIYDVDKKDYKIVVYKIDYNKRYYMINHRSILGSLMSLGIKRECIGDIIITDDNDAYVAVTEEISNYIVDSFSSVGKAPIKLINIDDEIENVVRYSKKLYFVSSLRLDVIIAASYNLSRNEALEFIKGGLVFINHILILNPSHMVKLNDEISVRHKGRVKLDEIGNETKSGRIAVVLAKRI